MVLLIAGVTVRGKRKLNYSDRACLHDPSVFSDPDVFLPERFIRDGKVDVSLRDPTEFAFGYGRRYGYYTWLILSSLTDNVPKNLPGPPLRSGRTVHQPSFRVACLRHHPRRRRQWHSYSHHPDNVGWIFVVSTQHSSSAPLRTRCGVGLNLSGCRYPEDCRCTIKPRSAEAVNLIRSHASAARAEDHV